MEPRGFDIVVKERPALGIIGNLIAPAGGSLYEIQAISPTGRRIVLARRGDRYDAEALKERVSAELERGTLTVDSRISLNPWKRRRIARFLSGREN